MIFDYNELLQIRLPIQRQIQMMDELESIMKLGKYNFSLNLYLNGTAVMLTLSSMAVYKCRLLLTNSIQIH